MARNPFLPEHEEKVDLSIYLKDAPTDDGVYARQNGTWLRLDVADTGTEAWQRQFNASLDWQSFDMQYRKLAYGSLLQVYIPSAVPLAAIKPGESLYFGNLPDGFRPVLEQEKVVPAMTTEGELDYVFVEFKANGNIYFTSHGRVKNLTVSETIMLT